MCVLWMTALPIPRAAARPEYFGSLTLRPMIEAVSAWNAQLRILVRSKSIGLPADDIQITFGQLGGQSPRPLGH